MTSYANASSETSNDKRNRKTQALSALLSATALGVFLEGCGGGDPVADAPPPTPAALGSASKPYQATGEGQEFTGSADADWVSYTGVASGVSITLNDNSITPAQVSGGAVGDTLKNIQNLVGSRQDDTLTGNDQANSLQGSAGNDIINGDGGADTLSGGSGGDTLNGGEGADTLHGGTGGDTLNGGAGADTLHGGAGNDEIIGGDGTDTINGGLGADTLDGGAGGDTLKGGGGDDTLEGGAGGDTLEGGAGDDTYIFRVGEDTDIINDGEGETLTLRFLGAYVDSDFTKPANGDGLFVRDGDDLVISIDKDSDDGITDQVTIEDVYDNTEGNTGYTIKVEYGANADNLDEVEAVDAYWHREGSERRPFKATAGDDPFTGKEGADWVSYAYAGFTPVTVESKEVGVLIDLNTGSGNPASVQWGAAGDTLIDIQNIIGTGYHDELLGTSEANIFHGNGGNDGLHGGFGADALYGGAGNDRINGDDGDDIIDGGKGNDLDVTGGRGEDTYIFRVGDGTDIIKEFLEAGGTESIVNLQFLNSDLGDYEADDFIKPSTGDGLFTRVDDDKNDKDDLVIAIDKNTGDGITDQVTFENAFDTAGKLLYTINVAYGTEGSLIEITDAAAYWNSFGTT